MPKRIALLAMVLSIAFSVISCEPTAPSSNGNSRNVQTNSNPTPSNSPPSSPPSSPPPAPAPAPCPYPPLDANRRITITAPCEGAKVAPRHFVEGLVSNENAQVWVVIHPMEVADFYVQPTVTVREGGKWKVLCYFGEPGQHSGKRYEVMAFANPKEKMNQGKLLGNWPAAEAKSQVIEVVRE